MEPEKKKSKINLIDVVIVCFVLTAVSFFFLREAFLYIGGFTLILFFMWLVFVWDDIVVWWSTRQ